MKLLRLRTRLSDYDETKFVLLKSNSCPVETLTSQFRRVMTFFSDSQFCCGVNHSPQSFIRGTDNDGPHRKYHKPWINGSVNSIEFKDYGYSDPETEFSLFSDSSVEFSTVLWNEGEYWDNGKSIPVTVSFYGDQSWYSWLFEKKKSDTDI